MSATSDGDLVGAHTGQTICLCMIVRNEAEVIERCLSSCRELLAYWVICDTGSSDGTQERIRAGLDGIPGELHELPWVDFGRNRSELMSLAYAKADYLLLIDADMTVAQTEQLPALTADAYLLRQGDAQFSYRNKRLVGGALRWRYVGSTHEFVECLDAEQSVEHLDALVIEHHGDGGSKADKFDRDRRLLEAELRENPDNARAVFYLAQTCRDIATLRSDQQALVDSAGWYERRTRMDGWPEELYCAWHQLGVVNEQLGSWPAAADAYMAAWEARPQRFEAVHDLVVGLLAQRRYHSAYRFTRLAARKPGLRVPEDILFVSPWIYEWGLLFQHTIAAYWCGDYDGSISACKRLLACEGIPDDYRQLTTANLQYAVKGKVRQVSVPRPERVPWPHAGRPTRGREAARRQL